MAQRAIAIGADDPLPRDLIGRTALQLTIDVPSAHPQSFASPVQASRQRKDDQKTVSGKKKGWSGRVEPPRARK